MGDSLLHNRAVHNDQDPGVLFTRFALNLQHLSKAVGLDGGLYTRKVQRTKLIRRGNIGVVLVKGCVGVTDATVCTVFHKGLDKLHTKLYTTTPI
jgi:hypothetical protein